MRAGPTQPERHPSKTRSYARIALIGLAAPASAPAGPIGYVLGNGGTTLHASARRRRARRAS
ncbi:hypothetical protein [Tautonia plasticadhaerens]|uniref:hypothetical protein n=1 Tax=Tautonia plasticadhaerens TaxID=2527974 RepID=UPI0011A7724C|nr:hypothetical protein [Tautonia plasticadhaerens]